MAQFLVNYSGFITVILSFITISGCIYSADTAKNYRLTLSELTIDRESRITLSLGMCLVGFFACISILNALDKSNIESLFLQSITVISCSLFALTAISLYTKHLTAHWYFIISYFLTAYIVQMLTTCAINQSFMAIPFTSILIFTIILWKKPGSSYWEISYAVFTCLYFIVLNLNWL